MFSALINATLENSMKFTEKKDGDEKNTAKPKMNSSVQQMDTNANDTSVLEEQAPQGDMSYYISRKEELLEKIQSIEQTCEGIDNSANCEIIIGLDAEKARLSSRNKEIECESKKISSRIKKINDQIVLLSKNSTDVILEGIKNQRWFFFKNKPSVLFDKYTGLLWANLNYYNYDDDITPGQELEDERMYSYNTKQKKKLIL